MMATQDGLADPSTSKVTVVCSCTPPGISVTASTVARIRSLLPTGTGDGNLTFSVREMAGHYPHLAGIPVPAAPDGASAVGPECDQQFEFEFALNLLLDGFERLRQQRWTPADQRRRHVASGPPAPRVSEGA